MDGAKIALSIQQTWFCRAFKATKVEDASAKDPAAARNYRHERNS